MANSINIDEFGFIFNGDYLKGPIKKMTWLGAYSIEESGFFKGCGLTVDSALTLETTLRFSFNNF